MSTPHIFAQELVHHGLSSRTHLSHDELCSEVAQRLNFVSIYRLFPFWQPFLQKQSLNSSSFVGGFFLPGSAWEMVWGSYMFDRKLRVVTMDALSRIEIALRTQIAYHWSAASKDEYPHVDLGTYKSAFLKKPKNGDPSPQDKLWKAVEKNFFRHKSEQGEIYEDVRLANGLQDLTIRAFMEFTTMGNLECLLRAGIKHKIVKEVARSLGFHDVDFFVSCVSLLTRVRNACAHQSRVWNSYWRTSQSLPVLRNAPAGLGTLAQEDRTGAALTVCHIFLRTIAPKSRWKERLLDLVNDGYLPVQKVSRILGFSSPLWHEHAFWKSANEIIQKNLKKSTLAP